ncbi:cyclic GMP-AMP synthase-like receptor [Anabrus simplex]|uniref:cyclic GMP-AMP synthase-like receptor n=1 Tax=Anabrus simplex TaxID=316456 RepID=UPI0035A300B6
MDETTEKRKYRVLEEHLNKLTKTEISLDEQEQKRYNNYLGEVLKRFVPAMKENDPLFDCTFKRFLYAGSSYENLKVGKPNEFDINLEFKLPSSDFEITDDREPGYVEVLVKSLDEKEKRRCFQNFPDGETKLRKSWLDDKGFLHRSKVSVWMQGVVDKAMKALGTIANLEILRSISGPAVTLKIKQTFEEGEGKEEEDGELVEFSVDLVPVFVFSRNEWPRNMRQPNDVTSPESQEWCIVPKPPFNRTEVTFWRLSFYAQEKTIMNNKHSMKKALKLIKLLRDKENWKNLSSYYIKTVFLWEITRQEEDFWSQGNVGFIFMHMLKRLKCNLKEGKIPLFWNEEVNLLVARSEAELQGMSNRLTKIIKKIDDKLEECPELILTFYRRSEDAVQNLESSPPSLGSSQERFSPPRTSQRETPRVGNLQTRPSPPRSMSKVTSSLETPKKLSEGSQYSGESDKKNNPRSTDSTTPSAPVEDDDERIDWRTVEAVIKIGAFAGAVFAAGAYLMLRNAQRQAREQAKNNSSSDNSSNTSNKSSD